ncbi:MAG: right-handed parallel beta-helix repeat-containing protein [Byssovorax sp.]
MRVSLVCSSITGAVALLLPTLARAQCPAPPAPGPGVITVNNNNNAGAGSLRAAIAAAVAGNTIRFAAGVCGQTINLGSALPNLAQGGIKLIGCAPGSEVVLSGAMLAGPSTAALSITSSDNRVCGLHVRDAPVALAIVGGSRNQIDDNLLLHNLGPGVVVVGPGAVLDNVIRQNQVKQNCLSTPLTSCAGIHIAGGAVSAGVQRTQVSANTVISNGTGGLAADGIALLDGSLHVVTGNFIGLDGALMAAMGNRGSGVVVAKAIGVEIGNNQIAANDKYGVLLSEGQDSRVHDNVIGVVVTGGGYSNGAGGVSVAGGHGHVVENNVIARNQHFGLGLGRPTGGGPGAQQITLRGNTISLNTGAGLVFDSDPTVRDNLAVDNTLVSNGNDGIWVGAQSFGNRLTQNRIGQNGGCGINLNTTGNLAQHPPAVTRVSRDLAANTVTVEGTLTLAVNPREALQAPLAGGGVVEVFWGSSAGAIAANYLGTVTAVDGRSRWSLTVAAPAGMPANAVFTATLSQQITTAIGTFFETSPLGESCDGHDQDCDGSVDEDFDFDGDGYATCGGDCDDADPARKPVDADGDGVTTCGGDCCDTDATRSTADADGDGVSGCRGDVDDGNAAVFPVGIERCNGVDDDGDGQIDEGFDMDGDGVSTCPPLGGAVDCNDQDPLVSPLAIERCDNGVDDDCDGAIDEEVDADGDGFYSSCVGEVKPLDPNDANVAIKPADPDGDGNPAGDCDETDPAKNTQDADGDGYDSCGLLRGTADCDDSDPLRVTGCAGARAPTTHMVTVNADGTFSPKWTWIKNGDTVEWVFPAVPAAAAYTDPIVPNDAIAEVAWVGDVPGLCSAYAPAGAADPSGLVTGDPNDFTGPKVAAASGIFSLGPNTVPYPAREETWSDGRISGVFLRFQWKDVHKGPGVFDFSALDHEIGQAVSHGKLYSVGFKAGDDGTPDWIFSAACGCNGAVPEVLFQDTGATANVSCAAGAPQSYGNPGDPGYECHYLALLEAVAAHIRTRSAWYRALAYIKISGANLVSHENRLPERCDCGDPDCNTRIWSDADYRPSKLYTFYRDQETSLLAHYPGKLMSYALIQDGFPAVNECGDYELANGTCSDCTAPGCTSLPGAFDQTQHILDEGQSLFGKSFVVQHNGIRVPTGTCGFEGLHPQPRASCNFDDPADACTPAPGEACFFDGADNVCNLAACPLPSPSVTTGCYWDPGGCPNKWVVREGAEGQLTGFQTVNDDGGVRNLTDLDATINNQWQSSDGVFLEIYDEVLTVSQANYTFVGPSGHSLGAWALKLHNRLKGTDTTTAWGTAETFPDRHRHTFTRTIASSKAQIFHYVHAARCAAAGGPRWGAIGILPD